MDLKFSRATTALAVLVFAVLAVALQSRSGAYTADLAAYKDEPAHVVSALLIHDYIVQGFPANPMKYAEDYYVRYPKVAIGHWPPLFHSVMGISMLALGRTKAAMLALLAVFCAALAASLFWWTLPDCGWLAAAGAAALLATAGFVRVATDSVMPDLLLSLLIFWAAVAWGCFLERGGKRFLVAYGLFTAMAVLTNGRGALALFIPPLANLIVRRWVVASAAALAAVCAISILLPSRFGQADPVAALAAVERGGACLVLAAQTVGWPIALAAALGLALTIRAARRRQRWAAIGALIPAAAFFHAVVNTPLEERYILEIAPAIVALAALAAVSLIEWIPANTLKRAAAIALLAAAALIAANNAIPRLSKPDTGYHRAVQYWHSPSEVYLVAGDPRHEGAAIAEMALLDPHLRRVVLRASKSLAWSTWAGRGYRPQFADANAVAAWLTSAHVGLLAIQDRRTPQHMTQLGDIVRAGGAPWDEMRGGAEPDNVRVYRLTTALPPGPFTIRVDMRDKLARYLELHL